MAVGDAVANDGERAGMRWQPGFYGADKIPATSVFSSGSTWAYLAVTLTSVRRSGQTSRSRFLH